MSIEQAMDNQYIRVLSLNTKRYNRAKMEKGGRPNKTSFGYMNDKGMKTIKVDEKKAPFIVRAFELYLTDGYSIKQVKNIFTEGSRAAERYLVVDPQEKRTMLEKLLSNASIKNGTVAQYQFKSPYQVLANTHKNITFENLCAH